MLFRSQVGGLAVGHCPAPFWILVHCLLALQVKQVIAPPLTVNVAVALVHPPPVAVNV